jgi:hypothetical protein
MRSSSLRRIRYYLRNLLRNSFVRTFFGALFIVFFSLFLIFSSVTLNVYLHEYAHYAVADYYGLNPSINIQNIVELDDSRNIVFNANPKAFTTFNNPHDDQLNFEVTVAGPLMNVLLTLIFSAMYIVMRYSLLLKSRKLKIIKDYDNLWKNLRLSFLVDVIFVSIIVPSLVSVFVNFSNIPGSDGSILRTLIK